MKRGDLVVLTHSRNSVKSGSVGLIVEPLKEVNFNNSLWFTCVFNGKLYTLHQSDLQVIDEAG